MAAVTTDRDPPDTDQVLQRCPNHDREGCRAEDRPTGNDSPHMLLSEQPTGAPAGVQRCGIGSTCDCAPEDKLAGIQRDLHESAAHTVQRCADGGGTGLAVSERADGDDFPEHPPS